MTNGIDPPAWIDPMSQHFLLSAAVRTLSLAQIMRMTDNEARDTFKRVRWSANDGERAIENIGAGRASPDARSRRSRSRARGWLLSRSKGRHRDGADEKELF